MSGRDMARIAASVRPAARVKRTWLKARRTMGWRGGSMKSIQLAMVVCSAPASWRVVTIGFAEPSPGHLPKRSSLSSSAQSS